MKKTAAILLAILLVSMLGGCYKSEIVMNVGYDGGVEVISSVSAPAEEYVKNGMNQKEDVLELADYLNETIKKETEKIQVECVDETGNALPDDTEWTGEEKTIESRFKAKYDSITIACDSPMFTNMYPYMPIGKDEHGCGIEIVEKRTLFGTKYTVSGNYRPYRKEMVQADVEGQIKSLEEQLAQYETMETATEEEAQYKEMYCNQIREQIEETKKIEESFKSIAASITFNFPFAFSKSNADSKNFFGNKLSWTTTAEAEAKEISFEVFVINPVILAAGFIILILLIVILILALKKKKKPDAFFVDAEGNEIPVYDVEETDEAFEDDAEVLVEAQETSEASEEAEDVRSFGDVMTGNEEAEKTNE